MKLHCSTLVTGRDQYGNVQTEDSLLAATYYDAIAVYLQIAQYTHDTATWMPCVQAAKLHYRDKYVLRTDLMGAVPGYWNFTRGVTLDSQLNGDAVSENAEILLSQKATYAGDATDVSWTVSPARGREVAYAIRAYLNAEKLGQPRRARLAVLINQAFGYVNQWFISKSYRCEPTVCSPTSPPAEAAGQYYVQPFMAGLTMEALIMYYDATPNAPERARTLSAIKTSADWLWANAWVAHDQAFWYENWAPDASQLPTRSGAPDLNLLIAPAYAWLYHVTGDGRYRDQGDQIFAGGVTKAFLDNPKQFDQNYISSFDYVKWRTLTNPAAPKQLQLRK